MSNIEEKKPSDLLPEEKSLLETFKNEGLLEINKISEADIFSWFNLYLSGRSYKEIAEITKANYNHVLYMADRHSWFDRKMGHFNNISKRLTLKIEQVKLESQDFILDLIMAMHKKYGQNVVDYLKTNDDDHLKKIDYKGLDKYFKSIEALAKISVKPLPPYSDDINNSNPSVHIHLGDSEVTRKDSNTVEIKSRPSIEDLAKAKKDKQT
jgi:hypothetical protein